ncbi:MAG: superoxide dismutase [Rikenellaceae bacterium]
MKYELPPLPYALDALEPKMSEKTLEYHHGKHHATYVANLNRLVIGTQFENAPIDKIIKEADGALFNNAAQAWNHTFFFNQFACEPKIEPSGKLLEAIEMSMGSFGSMKEQLSKAALALFGSGWVWLVKDGKELMIAPMSNAGTPIRDGRTPILAIDVWEHSYYIDHYNSRADYLVDFWDLVDWEVIEKRFK